MLIESQVNNTLEYTSSILCEIHDINECHLVEVGCIMLEVVHLP